MFILTHRATQVYGYDSHDLPPEDGVPFKRVVAHLEGAPFIASGITNVIVAFNVPEAMVSEPRHRIVLGPEHLPLVRKACGGLHQYQLDLVSDGEALPEYRPDWAVYMPLDLLKDTDAVSGLHSKPLIVDGLVFIAAYNEKHNIVAAVDYIHDAGYKEGEVAERTRTLVALLRQVGVPIPDKPIEVDVARVSFPGEPITLGADPEFELIRGGRIVSARHIIGSERTFPWGRIGLDGAGDQIELRPDPGSPEELVANVGRLLLSVPHIAGGYPSTMCEVWPTGGHIHIGFYHVGELSEYFESIVKAVDAALGDLFYSLNSKTRTKNGYGKKGDWRRQEWGIEYRTPPASVWSHPEVALTFLRAIEHIVKKMVREGAWSPDKDPEWSSLYWRAEIAAHLVRKYRGRLHWGAWKAWVGDFNLIRDANVRVELTPGTQCDGSFVNDLSLLLVRVGLPAVRVIPLKAERGERISNVPGYGELYRAAGEFSLANPVLALSWRFRNDPAFRREEIPRLERAILDIVSEREDGDANRLIKEPVALEGAWPDVPEPEPISHDDDDDEDDEDMIGCESCGELFHEDDIIYTRWDAPLCTDCYHRYYTSCVVCEREVLREDAIYYDDEPYCETCYANNFSACEVCEEDCPNDELLAVMVREGDDDPSEMYVCEYCRSHQLVEDDEEEGVYRIRR